MKQQLEGAGQTRQADWQWKGDVQTLSIDATHRPPALLLHPRLLSAIANGA